MVNWFDSGFQMCLFNFFTRTLVIQIGSLSHLTWTPDSWILLHSGFRDTVHCASHVWQPNEKVEIEKKIKEFIILLHMWHKLCKGTTFVLTKNWENHWNKHFAYILWQTVQQEWLLWLISLLTLGCQPSFWKGWVLGNHAWGVKYL